MRTWVGARLAWVMTAGCSAPLALGCGGGEVAKTGDGPLPAPQVETPTSPADERSPWRFRPTLDQHLPPDAVGQPVMELSEPRSGTAVIVAAVLRAGAPHVEIERWTFKPNPDGQTLDLVEEGLPVLRLRPDATRHPELAELRRRLAAPRVVLTRPAGLDVPEPGDLVPRISTALTTMQDPQAQPRARVEAAATVIRGLDDAVVLEHDGVGELATLLVPTPRATAVEVHSKRRATVTVAAEGQSTRLGLQRKALGWVIASVASAAATGE